ncbi:MAG: xylose isomerase [Armatimonadetes bacterium CG2_30_59_28]|nr:sugar phosphate isomerase/epimerase [Armatimonadota bacterium]OIO96784.1 MAG: xylose isomerase [Armatimonadetes bacterium CG2_30_59_28]PIU62509.1 MAG: sugar phosphate isomerase/epimerase [Armatimonadetes bacterium CG07_land_8_20_14_0_80_59_28]PIY48441.1 MAG: sugar phosphate isomerase/epimerase [Armatimonadetes bacterium CG_4_10_14_3_um_filter_59_10]PJB64481.1 MAG: sugar phosphate isomerase/epimerase [Armatimonadetes bacterium CG_4_9_14_3_um_filter_58_7]
MKLGLINSAWAQAGRETAWGIKQTKRIGFDTLDIATDPLDIDPKEKRRIIDTAADCELPVVSLCCVAVGLTDFNPSVQRFSLERVTRFLDLCYEFRARNLLLVIGEYIWQQEVIPPSLQWEFAVENVRKVGRHAKSLGLEIVIELEPFRLSLINSVETMSRFLRDVDMPKTVRANCDISHLHLVRTPIKEIPKLKGKIGHVHLSDCDGKVHGDLPPGRGATPIKRYLSAIRDTGYDGVVSIELEYSPAPERIVEWVEEAYCETDRIMQELQCRG